MPTPNTSPTPPHTAHAARPRRVLLFAAGVLLAMQVLNLLFLDSRSVQDAGLVGPDAYMRLIQVGEFYDHGRWYDTTHYRLNAPFTETNQWTRPMDVLLLPGAWLGDVLAGDPRGGLWLGGVLVGPVLLGVWLGIWWWGTRGILGTMPFLIGVMLIGISPSVNSAFMLGRPDHHGLQLLLMVLPFCAFLRAGMDGVKRRHGWIAGAAAGLGIWVSIEAVVIAAVLGLWAAWRWIAQREDKTETLLSCYLAGLVASLAGSIMLDHPPAAWTEPFYSRISIVHFTLFASGALPCLAYCWLHQRGVAKSLHKTPGKRAALIAAAACISIATMACVHPTFFTGPFSDFDRTQFANWLTDIQEWQPLLPTDRPQAARFMVRLLPSVLGAGFIAWRLWQGRRDMDARLASIYGLVTLAYAAYIPLALWGGRFTMYTQALNLLALPLMIDAIMRSERLTLRFGGEPIPLRVVVAAAVLGLPMLLGGLLTPPKSASTPDTAWRSVAQHLDRLDGVDADTVVFSYLYQGPILLWNARFRVVGGPYGQTDALRDTHDFFSASDDMQAAAIVLRRDVRYILVAHQTPENHFYTSGPDETFLMRLLADRPPAWATEIGLPDDLSKRFKLYRTEPHEALAQHSP